MNRKNLTLLVVLLLLVALTASVASAAAVHLKGGKHAEPDFTDNVLTLTADGALSGLGNGDVLVSISAIANPTASCANPSESGQHEPPGQNPAAVEVTGSQFIPEDELGKNGNTPFGVTTEAPETPILDAPDCPNPNWTEEIVDMAFTSAIITVEQPVGTLVLTVTCTLSPPTLDGAVPGGTVNCTSS